MSDSIARVVILTLTVIALIYILTHQPQPVIATIVPYCEITYRLARKDVFGDWHFRWVVGNGPCSLQDIYRDI